MARPFIDEYLPSAVPGYPCLVSPRTSTTITVASGGDEGRNRNWKQPLRHIKLPAGEARQWVVIEALMNMFIITDGPYADWPFRDPFDFASVALNEPNEPAAFVVRRISALDQNFGTGDGVTRTFQLTKLYGYGAATKVRKIGLPVLDALKVAVDGTPTTAFSVTRPGGVVTFDVAPLTGKAITWGGLFDIPVRFDSDTALDAVVAAYRAGGFAEINLDEQRVC